MIIKRMPIFEEKRNNHLSNKFIKNYITLFCKTIENIIIEITIKFI